jgi:arabinogalactan oligomer/maltooligosaccharide transport system permease protein
METRRIIGNVIIYIILAVMSIIWLAPVAWLVLESFNIDGGLSAAAELWPNSASSLGFQNYIGLFTNQFWSADGIFEDSTYNFFGWTDPDTGVWFMGAFLNTFVISLLTMVISTFLTLASSYAFSRLRFKGRTGMMRAILIMGMFPGFLGIIIMYWIMDLIGLSGSIWALVIIYSGGAGMGYYISKGFFDTIPKAVDEAAMVDGATRFQIFYKITLPLAKPIVVYTALTSFMGPWAEYITASYILGPQSVNRDNWTVAVLLQHWSATANGGEGTESGKYWGSFCAGAVLVAIPTSLLFIFLQKNYVSGVTGGAVKG